MLNLSSINKDVLNIQQTCKYKIQEDEYPGAP